MNLRSLFFLLALALIIGCDVEPDAPADETSQSGATFVNEAECVECHQPESESWVGSHHDLAMQESTKAFLPSDGTIPALIAHGSASSVRRDGGRLFISTQNAQGEIEEFPVSAVFGVDPLQQYVVDFGDSRRQVSTVAMDTRRGRLFSVRGTERIQHDDELHWTRPAQNWNYMCAECHATGLKRNYNPKSNSFATTAHRFDVGCQACHGPASEHLRLANNGYSGQGASGFEVELNSSSQLQVENCARCHSRRAPISDGYDVSKSLHDDYRVSFLDEGLYYADGQIEDEVYVYGSFVQSKMHHAGVRCTDCHNPHSGKTKLDGNALCTSCHNNESPAAGPHINTDALIAKVYNSPKHHNHASNLNIQCVDCHAPTTTYMQIDKRHDHSFRIPRPDLSVAYGVPNACNKCHTSQSFAWAAEALEQWDTRSKKWHYVEAIDAGRRGLASAPQLLARVVNDLNQPAIVRATALELMARYPDKNLDRLAEVSLHDKSPLVRRAAVAAHASLQTPEAQIRIRQLLNDPVKSVRFEALSLADLSKQDLAYAPAIREYISAQNVTGGSGSAALNLGSLYARMGEVQQAEAYFRQSIREDEFFLPGWVNLADVVRYRSEGESEQILRTALDKMPKAALLYYVLGLSLTRQQRMGDAIKSFKQAVLFEPENGQYKRVLQMAKER